jgi:hypothetical protein
MPMHRSANNANIYLTKQGGGWWWGTWIGLFFFFRRGMGRIAETTAVKFESHKTFEIYLL